MAISAASKSLLADGIWARSEAAARSDPEDFGLTLGEGWPIAYEQQGGGKEPEREVFNELDYRHDAGITDIFAFGIPAWDAEVDYYHGEDASAFVTTPGGLWVANEGSGPSLGNSVDPDTPGQLTWRRY